ncbi:MAG TPA: sigma factor-like helix-turn-helix DNA-binding protein, partial [Fibrobacteria bacterium]|nr:sigma factor-like helix-turn-helix DNA-binding protein [Fibrobacteria bacterium]
IQIGQYSLALHEPALSDEEGSLGESLEDGMGENPEQKAVRDNLQQEVWGALEGLRGVEREVLRLHFGLGSAKALNLEEIATLLGLTRAKVRKIRDDAMNRLRHPGRRIRFRELI